ncbi:hypothetical protein D9R35_24700, partial [Escherichia coli]|nr:hypothetical protein [Escherichia coli]
RGFKSPSLRQSFNKINHLQSILILSCINPCIKIPFSRSIFLTTDAVFYHFAARWASTFMHSSSHS